MESTRPKAGTNLPLERVHASACNRTQTQHDARSTPRTFRTAQKPERRATRHPIVLVHGYIGFDVLKLLFAQCEYFRGVRAHLEGRGHEVHVVRVPSFGGIRVRAEQLAEQLEKVSSGRVNVVAHSMGGLDARYAISKLGLDHKIASLTTIGTPHAGTALADGVVEHGEWRWLKQLLDMVGRNEEGLMDLTTRKMSEFNGQVLDSPRVLYRSVVGTLPPEAAHASPWFTKPYAYLLEKAGINDGLVPAASQRWGRVVDRVDADHFAQVGWSRSFDACSLYGGIARTLATRGL
jgi:triacylglycerol lipase